MVNRGSVNRRWKRPGCLTPRRPEIAGAAVIPRTNNNVNRLRAPRIQQGESSVIPTEDNSDRLSATGIRLGGSAVIPTGDNTARIKRQRTGILLPSSVTEEFVFPPTPAVYSPSARRVIRFPKSLRHTDATWLINSGRRVVVNGKDQELEIAEEIAPTQPDNVVVNGNDQELEIAEEIAPNQQDNVAVNGNDQELEIAEEIALNQQDNEMVEMEIAADQQGNASLLLFSNVSVARESNLSYQRRRIVNGNQLLGFI